MRKSIKKTIAVVLSVLFVMMSMGTVAMAEDETTEVKIGDTGTFNFINCNVDGLPIPSSMTSDDRDALMDNVLIAQQLNERNFSIVALQEDFNYDSYLRAQLTNYANKYSEDGKTLLAQYQTEHKGGVPLGDGLNIFSKYQVYNVERVEWEVKSGNIKDPSTGGTTQGDELTEKGFMVVTIEPVTGYYIDIYDLHADAFGSVDNDPDSIKARQAEFAQLATYIMKHSVYDETTGTYDHAVIVTGDFNTSICSENDSVSSKLVENLIEKAHLNDAWAVRTIDNITETYGGLNSDGTLNTYDYTPYYDYAERTVLFEGYWGHYDSVERFCYASGNGIKLSCDSFKYEMLYDSEGRDLSDHYTAQASFTYEIVEKAQDILSQHDKTESEGFHGFLLKFLNYIASIFHSLGIILQNYKNWLK